MKTQDKSKMSNREWKCTIEKEGPGVENTRPENAVHGKQSTAGFLGFVSRIWLNILSTDHVHVRT